MRSLRTVSASAMFDDWECGHKGRCHSDVDFPVAFVGEHRARRAIDDKALTILLQKIDNSLKHPR